MAYQVKPYQPKRERKICIVDIEGYRDFQKDCMVPYLVGVYNTHIDRKDRYDFQEPFHYFKDGDCVKEFIDRYMTYSHRGYVFYAHFGSIFDFPIILSELDKRPFNIYPIMKGSKIIKMTVADDSNHRWYFCDSSALLSFSLDELTKTFKVTYKKLHVVEKNDSYDRNLYRLYKENPALVIEYLKHDCIGLYEVLNKFKKEILNIGGDLGLTIASTSLKTFTRSYQKNPFYMCSKAVNDELRNAYFGGRTEIFRMLAPELKDDYYYYYDINSLYPFVMKKYSYPVSQPKVFMVPDKNIYAESDGITQANIKAPTDLYIPVLPSKIKIKQDNKLMFTVGSFGGWWDNHLLRKAKELGYQIDPIKSYSFKTEFIFKEFVDNFYRIKQNAEKDTPMYLIAKLLMNCFSGDTNIYTSNGIKNIREIKKDEYIYSINPKSLKIGLQKVEKVFKYKYNGKMLFINQKNCNFLVTPNHRFLVKQWYNDYKFIMADEIMSHNSSYIFPSFSKIRGKKRKTIKIGNNTFNFNDWLEFIGWYISEGHLRKTSINGFQINITQKVYSQNIKLLLLKMGFRYSTFNNRKNKSSGEFRQKSKSDKGFLVCLRPLPQLCFNIQYSNGNYIFRIHHKDIYNWLLEYCKKYSQNKRMPSFLFQYDSSHLQFLYKSLMLGDGFLTRKSKKSFQMQKYTTISKQLANDFSRLCLHLGKKTRVYKEKTYSNENTIHPIYRVFIYSHKNTMIRPNKKSWKQYKGYVYCLSLKNNHTILAGRKNLFEFIGQSLYGKYGQRQISESMIKDPDPDKTKYTIKNIDIETGWARVEEEGKGKSYLPQIAIHVTAMAQLWLYESLEKIVEKGYKVFYCDTDSITTDYKNLVVSKELGDWKLEKRISSGYFLLPKTYKIVDDSGKTELRAKGYSKKLQSKIAEDAFRRALMNDDYSGFSVISDNKEMLRASASFHRFKDFNKLDYIRRSIQTRYNKRKILKDFDTRPYDMSEII